MIFSKKLLFYLCVFLIMITSAQQAFCCTAMMIDGPDYQVISFNENWKSLPGLIVENKRGVEKQSISWNELTGTADPNEKKMSWTSLYGSLTFSCLSKEFPIYGINEKGLFVVELYLYNTKSPEITDKARVFWPQWIQYHLDNFATVTELIEGLESSPVPDWWPSFPGSQLYVTDAQGNYANITQIEGEFVIHTGETMPIPVLSSRPYQSDYKRLTQFKDFGGCLPCLYKKDRWSTRFIRAAHSVNNYPGPEQIDPVEYGWTLADTIVSGIWQLVIDVKKMRLYFTTDKCPERKYFDMSNFTFDKNDPVKYMDIHCPLSGDVNSAFKIWSPEENEQFIQNGFPISYYADENFYQSQDWINLKNRMTDYVTNFK